MIQLHKNTHAQKVKMNHFFLAHLSHLYLDDFKRGWDKLTEEGVYLWMTVMTGTVHPLDQLPGDMCRKMSLSSHPACELGMGIRLATL